MIRMTVRSAVAAAFLVALSSVATAQGQLTLVIGGEAYDGPPKFEVLFDDTVIGEGTVDAAIDTARAGRFAQTTVKAPYVQSFDFEIPTGVFNAGGDVRIRFLNEAYGGDGSNRDRNLYVASVTINGAEVLGPAMTTQSAAGLEPSAILGDFLVIFDGTADAVIAPPDMGWPEAGTVLATVEPETAAPSPEPDTGQPPRVADAEEPETAPEPEPDAAIVAADPAPEPEVAASEAEPAPAAQPDADIATAPATDPQPPAVDPVETAALSEPIETVPLEVPAAPVPAPPPAAVAAAPASGAPETVDVATATESPAVPGCVLDNLYNVLGFNENSNDLTPRITERLDQIINDIGDNVCTLQLTGYSSSQGDVATNALFAVERAQNVLRYLREKGLRYVTANAVGAGGTDEFGPALSDNRRVVIRVSP